MAEPRDPRAERVGVAALPNRCGSCGKFKRWEELTTHFVPDTEFSSENESWRECDDCQEERTAPNV